MFLVKCKCSSIFTLTEDGIKSSRVKCPNCSKLIPIDQYTSLSDNQGLTEVVEYVRSIPDNAKITVTFDA